MQVPKTSNILILLKHHNNLVTKILWVYNFRVNKTLNFKEPKNTKRSRKKLLIYVSLAALFIFVFAFVFLLDAKFGSPKPGDLLFSVKSILEENREPEGIQEKAKFKLGLITDRVQAINALSAESRCTQLILAEENLIGIVEDLNEIIITNENTKEYYEKMYTELQNLNSNEACPIRNKVLALQVVFRIFAVTTGTQLDFNALIQASQEKYDAIVENLKQTSFTNQETLTAVNSALEKAKANFTAYDEAKANSDFNTLNLKLIENDFIYSVIDNLVELKEGDITQEDVVRAFCTIDKLENENCEKAALDSSWNSIYSKPNPVDQIELGSEMIKNFFSSEPQEE